MNDFIELHDKNDGKPILVRVKAIDCVRSYSLNLCTVTILTIGNKEYNITESYEEIKNMILGQPIIKQEYSEEDKELINKLVEELKSNNCTNFPITALEWPMIKQEDIKRFEKFLDEWNRIGCTTFSSSGMTDDRAIAGLSDD